ncbi:MAG: hypothetical protein ACFFD1_10185 [Candidatus Thorarchaeota archaeon]
MSEFQLNRSLFELFDEKFGKKNELTPQREDSIIRSVSTVLRRFAMEIWGHVSTEEIEPLRKKAMEYLWPEVVDYPIIIAKGVVAARSKYYDPRQKSFEEVWVEFRNNPKIIEDYKEKFFDALFQGFKGGANYELIGKNLVQIFRNAKS